jgi:peroxiredoxin
MNKKDILITAVLLIIIGIAAALWLSPGNLSQSAPDVSMQDLTGKQFRLSDLGGKPVLITFWATTCPGCLKEQPHLVELYEKHQQQGLNIIGIAMSYDPADQVRTLVANRNLPYTIVMDSNGELARAFGNVRLTPTSFMITPDGRIQFKKIGEMDMHSVEQSILEMLEQKG